MSFSRLLLVAANSKKCITGKKNDKVCVSAKISSAGRDAYEGEVILCFQLDDTEQGKGASRSLGIAENNQRCDGLVFYSQAEKPDRVICLVEMKSTNITEAASQIISTKDHIKKLLEEECGSLPERFQSDCKKQIAHIIWRACLYHHSSSPAKVAEVQRSLKQAGFDNVDSLRGVNNDLRPLLSGEGRSAREIAKQYKDKDNSKR